MSKQVVDFYPDEANFLDTYGWILYQDNKLEEAEKYSKKAISIDQKNDEFKKTLSLILLKKYDLTS